MLQPLRSTTRLISSWSRTSRRQSVRVSTLRVDLVEHARDSGFIYIGNRNERTFRGEQNERWLRRLMPLQLLR